MIRQSNRLWAGLPSDLIIKQVLMRSLKRLTRGREITEHQWLLWLLSRPACAEVNQAMLEFTRVYYNSGEQNQDMTNARHVRDWKDTLTVLQYLQERNPFSTDPSLRSIATGVHDPQLLFHRLITVGQSSDELKSAFEYELCSYPSALFDSSLLLREAVANPMFQQIFQTMASSMIVLDGGALLQCITWSRGSTYRDICRQYTEYVTRKYGDAIIIFDGYEKTNTKDMTHQRRSKRNAGTTVPFTADMPMTMKNDQFLANRQNKQQFIYMLSEAGPGEEEL